MRKREMFDGYSVNAYQARFAGTIDVEDEFAESLYTGRVTVWLLAARNGEAQFKEHPDGDSVTRKNVQKIEMAVPLDGELRNDAIVYLSHAGTQGGVSFRRERDEGSEIDRLAGFLLRNFGQEIGADASESAVDVAVRLLERVLVEKSPVIEVPDGVDAVTGEIVDPRLEEDLDAFDAPVVPAFGEPVTVSSIYDRPSADRELIDRAFQET